MKSQKKMLRGFERLSERAKRDPNFLEDLLTKEEKKLPKKAAQELAEMRKALLEAAARIGDLMCAAGA